MRLADDWPLTHHLTVRVEFQFMYICGYCNFNMFCAILVESGAWDVDFHDWCSNDSVCFPKRTRKVLCQTRFLGLRQCSIWPLQRRNPAVCGKPRGENTAVANTSRGSYTWPFHVIIASKCNNGCFFCFATLYWLKTARKTAGRVGRDSCCVIVFLLRWLWVLGWREPTLCRPFDLSLRGPCWPFPRVVVQKRTAWDSSQNPAENHKCLSNL